MSTCPNTPVKFLIVSDTHDLDFNQQIRERLALPPADVIPHCGDLTDDGAIEGYKKAAEWLLSLEAELKLVIAGNHDLSLDEAYMVGSGKGSQDHQAAKGFWKRHCDQGLHYLEEGTYEFTLRCGAYFKIYASPYQPLHGNYSLAGPDCVTNASSLIPSGVDIVMTHAPAMGVLDKLLDGRHRGCEHLMRAIARVKPRMHCFGHVHYSNGIQKLHWLKAEAEFQMNTPINLPIISRLNSEPYECATRSFSKEEDSDAANYTLAVNASIGNEGGNPVCSPWLVTLALPRDC
ncbi:Metallo-dependent phosphatase [Corynespora cassiicola Philippines]|uniref:Metallo-dependent phosphatase n=1 Tax=Corynespora cassiicola Philippines TaxID=1448308 RepID=A0A2T2N9K8_CORCC|nr:Metallo-dependent phosphatase [Corynespora cassiicola Philippines]